MDMDLEKHLFFGLSLRQGNELFNLYYYSTVIILLQLKKTIVHLNNDLTVFRGSLLNTSRCLQYNVYG